jgi:uncharacterized metal-binding protein
MSSIGALGLYFGAHSASYSQEAALAFAGGCLAGVLITPDLDVDEPTRSHYVVGKTFGLLPFVIWRLLWLPYGKLIGHRAFISHFPIVGTSVRLLYLAAAWMILRALFGLAAPLAPWWLPHAVTGLLVSDTLHWLADVSWSKFKRFARSSSP